MYLIIAGNKHTVSKRIVQSNQIRYLSVTPEPKTISGKIQMYENNGFLISEDNVGGFLRSVYSGTLLTLTNVPEPVPVERPVEPPMGDQEVSAEEMADAILEGVNDV